MIQLSSSILDFGSLSKGQTSTRQVTIYNISASSVNITNIISSSSDYEIAPLAFSIDANSSKNISIKYTANDILFAIGTISVSNTAGPDEVINTTANILEPIVILITSPLNFPKLSIDDSLTLSKNIGNSASNGSQLIANVLSIDSNFVVMSPVIIVNAGSTADILIKFLPTTVGIKSGTINITTNDSIGSYSFNVNGEAVIPTYTLSSSFLSFGSVPVNDYKTMTFSVTNTSIDVNLIISSVTIGDSVFSIDVSSVTIAPLQSQIFTVTFLPLTSETISGLIALSNNTGSDINVNYSGTGLIVPAIQLLSTNIDIGIYTIFISKTFDITIQNVGVVDLVINDIVFPIISGTIFSSSISYPYIVNRGDEVVVTVTVNSSVEITYSGIISIVSNAYNSPHAINISGISQSALIVVDVASLDFGTIQVGEQKILSFVVKNTRDVDLSVLINDINAFTVSENNFIVSGHSSHTISVTFTLDTVGSVSEVLTIISNDIFSPTVAVNLLGSADVNHSFTLIPDKITNNYISKSITSITELTIINRSLLTATIDSLTVTDLLGVATYSITVNNLPVTLAPGEATIVDVSLLASTVGKVASDLKFNTHVSGIATSIVIRYEGEIFAPTINLSDDSINFGSVAVGDTSFENVIITNDNSNVDLSVELTSNNDAFHFKQSGEDDNLVVSYVNSKYVVDTTKQGLILDSVTVVDSLTGEQYALGDPANVNEFSVNTDTGVITVNSVLNNKSLNVRYDHKLSTLTLNIHANASTTISIGFSPQRTGIQFGTITVLSNDDVNPTLIISLAGDGIPNIASMIQDSALVKFIAKVGKSVSQKVKLKNTGTVKLYVTSVTCVLPFSVANSQYGIDPNETFDLEIIFQPTNDSDINQTVTVHSNAPDLIIPVNGQGAYSHILLPTSFDFGESPINIKTDKILTVSNTAIVNLDVQLQINSAYFSVTPLDFTILANSTYDVVVSFKPTEEITYSKSLKIISDDPTQHEINYTITGIGKNKPVIEVASRLEFDRTNVRETSQKMLEVFNRGSATLQITNISIIENLASYSISSASFASIPPGASTQFTIIFSPQSAPKDYITGKLKIVNNTDNPNVEVLLKGKGNQPKGEWQAFNLSSMMPDAIISTANAIDDVIDPLKTVLNLIKQVVDLVKVLLIDTQSALKVILDKIFKVIKNYTDDLLSFGVYILPIFPSTSYYDPDNNTSDFAKFLASIGGGSDYFKRKIADSFDDLYDSQRPQFSDSAICGAYVIAVDSGNVSEVVKGIIALNKIFTAVDWQPNVQEPQSLEAISGSQVILRWELPEFLTFNVAGIFNKQKFIDLIEGFEVYRSEEPLKMVTATQRHTDPNNSATQISNVGDVIDVTTFRKLDPIGTVAADQYHFRIENFATGWKNADNKDTAKAMGYEFNDDDVQLGKNYYYVVRTKLGDIYSKLSNEVTGSRIDIEILPATDALNRCVNFRCIKTKGNTKIIRTLQRPIVKLINRTGIIIQSESRYNKNGVIPDANEQQVNTFTFFISSVNIDINNIIIRNPTEAERRIAVDKLTVKSTLFFDNGEIKIWDDGTSTGTSGTSNTDIELNREGYFNILNDTKLVPGWDLLVTYRNNNTYLTINDISNAGYKQGDYIVIEYYASDYTAQCTKQMDVFDAFKCNSGENKGICPNYSNARCIYHGGTVCLNNGNTKLGNRCISNKTFFDAYRCQDSSMGGEVKAIDKMKRNDLNYCIDTTGVCAGYQSLSEQSVGLYPNWIALTSMMSLIKPVDDFILTLQAWVNREIDAIQKGSQTVEQFIDLLSNKIEELEKFIDTIQKILDTLLSIFSSNVGFYILSIDAATGGPQRVKQLIQSAEGGPSSGSSGYTAGIVLFIGAPDAKTVRTTYQFLRLFFK